jgi:hypothetical protein
MKEVGVIKKEIEYKQAFDSSFIEKAQASLM